MSDYDKYYGLLAKEANDNIYADLGAFGGDISSTVGKLLAQDVRQPVEERQYDVGESMLISAISGLLGGGLSEYGRQSAADDMSIATDILLRGSSPRSSDLSSSLFKTAQNYSRLYDASRKQEFLEKLQDAKIEVGTGKDLATFEHGLDMKKSLFENFMENPEGTAASLKQLAQITNAEEAAVSEPIAAPVASGAAASGIGTAVPTGPSAPPPQPTVSLETQINDKITADAKRIKTQFPRMTDESALITARKAYEGQVEELGRSYEAVEEATRTGEDAIRLAQRGRAAATQAGDTGTLGELRGYGAKLLGELGFAEQAQKAAGGDTLRALQGEVVGVAGQHFKGPMSDRDIQIMLQRFVSENNTEVANAQIADQWEYAGLLQRYWGDFMRQKRREGLPVFEAEQEWQALVRSKPYVEQKADGTYEVSQEWRDILAGKKSLIPKQPQPRISFEEFKRRRREGNL